MTQNKRSPKKIPSHFGMYNYYNHYLNIDYGNDSSKVSNVIFNKIIGDTHKEIIESIIKRQYTFCIPYLGFDIYLVKYKGKFFLGKDKKSVINTSPIDWVKTRKLWAEYPEAEKNNTLLRYLNKHTNGYIFKIFLQRRTNRKSTLKSKFLYAFNASRYFKRRLAKLINEDRIEPIDCKIINKRKWQQTEE